MEICALIGLNVRTLRQQKRWSQEELAFNAKMDRAYLSQVENGHKNITILMLADIAAALKVRPIDLMKNSQDS